VIPIVAVDRDGDASGRVMVVTNNRVESRRVTLGLEGAQNVEIRSGLNAADRVVLSGHSTVHPGEEVRPKITSLRAYAQ
jgi:multidrug efflux pump subunit AcrA (membrane-fusion protein)